MLRVIVTPLRNDNSGRTEQLMAEYGALKTKWSLKLVYRSIHISYTFRIFITCLLKEAI